MNSRFVLAACLAFSAGCHSSSTTTTKLTPPDMTEPPDLAPPGDMATPFPAVAEPDVPQTITYGGPVIANPKVVVITFPNDDNVADIETFVSTLGDQSYWASAVSEYGVGKITTLANIHDPTSPPAKITSTDIQNYLSTKINDPTSGFPAPDNDTIYALFYPSTVTIDDGDGFTSCTAYGGYHSETGIANSNQTVIYAVLPRCTGVFTHDPAEGDFGYLTSASSHEFIEASEDPFPSNNPAYADVDDAHYQWSNALGGGETGDLCAQNSDADFVPDGFGYWVQRNWSNEAAASGKDPCVPAAAGEVYASVSNTTATDSIKIGGGGFSVTIKGYNVEVGVPRTIELELFSDKPTDAPLSVAVKDFTAYVNGTTSKVTLDIDPKTGVNGTKLTLTVTAKAMFGGHGNTDTILVTTTSGGVPKFWFGFLKSVAAGSTPTPDMGAP